MTCRGQKIKRSGRPMVLESDVDKLDLREFAVGSCLDFVRFAGELSDDARLLARLAVCQPEKYRSGTLFGLLSGMGWSTDRIRDSFREMREAVA